MKTDHLLPVVIHLLNHDTMRAAKLAERFEVSKRTILRDIEQISLAGVPIRSLPGANGGYSNMEGYKLDGRFIYVNYENRITYHTPDKTSRDYGEHYYIKENIK